MGTLLTFTGMEPLPFATVEPYTTVPFDNGFTYGAIVTS
jgi:hypothetical protein